jgi:hypothetical protein
MFSGSDRERLRDWVIARARADARVVAGAVIGSLADSDGDRWSDLDLTFGVVDGDSVQTVLDDFTGPLVEQFGAVPLFDLPAGPTIYRVFMLPGCLQFDLSFAPASEFAALGPKFRLLFGTPVERPHPGPPAASQLFGYAVHHAVRARVCIERGRFWQAEYWLSALRDHALTLACRSRGLPAYFGRGFDDLPDDVRGRARPAVPASLDRDELLRALGSAVGLLLSEATEVRDLAEKLERHLHDLCTSEAQP